MPTVEAAKSGRASCRACGQKIFKGTLRVGVEAMNDWGFYFQWQHVGCHDLVGDERSLAGYSALSEPQRAALREEVAQRRNGPNEDEKGPEQGVWRLFPAVAADGAAVDAAYRDEHDVVYGAGTVDVVGLQYYDGASCLGDQPFFGPNSWLPESGVIHDGEFAILMREPENPYDANAVRVENLRAAQVGHLKRCFAAALAPMLDDPSPAAPTVECAVETMMGGGTWLKAAVTVSGLPEHAEATAAYLDRRGIRLRGGVALPRTGDVSSTTRTSTGPSATQKDLDALFDALAAELQATDTVPLEEAVRDHLPALTTKKLCAHQLQGLAWCLAREAGRPIGDAHEVLLGGSINGAKQEGDPPLPPLWDQRVELGRTVYFNSATNTSQPERPPALRGGVIADAMGLGKTLTALALICARMNGTNSEDKGQQTLVVCPVSVLHNWVAQAAEHTALSVAVYHGADRTLDSAADIVVTTFGTLQADHAIAMAPQVSGKKKKKKKKKKKRKRDVGGLLDFTWRRVVYDEAHVLRNTQTKSFKAASAVVATHRWCLTGTPVVNKCEDLQALFALVRAPPVDDAAVFRRAIAQPLKEGDVAAVARLRLLVRSLALRRPKATLAAVLPPRTMETHLVELGPENRRAYDALYQTAAMAMDAIGADDALLGKTSSSVLECITRLRQVCSGGGAMVPAARLDACYNALDEAAGASSSSSSKKEPLTAQEAVALLDRLRKALGDDDNQDDDQYHPGGEDSFECVICFDVADRETDARQIRTCGHVFCASCAHRLATTRHCALCRAPFTPADLVSVADLKRVAEQDEDEDEGEFIVVVAREEEVSPKVAALVAAVRDRVSGDERVVAFSSFIGTIDRAARALKSAGFVAARIVGSMSRRDRGAALDAFGQTTGGPKVLLVSTAAGGTGLNLVRANLVYILDPAWNAAVEDQAIDRVHRISQTRPVTAVRLVAARTVEERILDLQDHKSAISDAALNQSDDDRRHDRLRNLRRLFDPSP